MIHCLYIFARDKCLFYDEWNRTRKPRDFEEEKKLVWGLAVTFKSIASQLSPSTGPSPPIRNFNSFSTPKYKMHFYETPTGYRFVLCTDPQVNTDIQKVLAHIYSNLFVPLVLKNTAWQRGAPVQSPNFSTQLKTYLQKRPEFSSFA